MKVEYLHYYNETATLPVDIKEVFNRKTRFSIHMFLDFFLKSLKIDYLESFDTIIHVLRNRFQQRGKLPFEITEENSILDGYPDLKDGVFNDILSEMRYRNHTKEGQALAETIEVNVTDFLKARLFCNYKIATSLTEILPRDKAIDYYKKIVNELIRSQRDPNMYIEDLDERSKKSARAPFPLNLISSDRHL